MKDLNRYIKESLLDDEDDLVDDNASIVMGWLAQNVGFGFSHSPLKDRVKDYFENNDGRVDMTKNMGGLIFTFINTPPDFIKKINAENNYINIDYPIKSQNDIDVFTDITYISNQKLLKNMIIPLAKNRSRYNTLEFVNISKIQNITIDCNGRSTIHVVFTGRCPIKSFNDLAEISCINNDKSFQSTFEMYGSFTQKIKEELELQNLDMNDKAINSYINEKYGDILNKIHEKSGCSSIVLGKNVNAPSIDYNKGKWSYNK